MLEQDKRAAFYRTRDVVWSAATPREGTGVPTTLALLRRAQLGSRFGGLRNFFVDRVGISPSPTVGDCCEALRKLVPLYRSNRRVTTVKRTPTPASVCWKILSPRFAAQTPMMELVKAYCEVLVPPPAPAPVLPLPATWHVACHLCLSEARDQPQWHNYLASCPDQMRGTLPPRFLDVAALLQFWRCAARLLRLVYSQAHYRAACVAVHLHFRPVPTASHHPVIRRFVQMAI